ncbi:cyclic nucleotide-binding protein [Dyadobacter endophyticus]|uniref:Cyclic nucleotide-binding protein n=1 Tax=Dyadobacter endophyticus TaxID=1749036 RepID=A0ABQ1YJL8_9BACT|nr:Crp/Fnr family transcriptional regulator [Dyadobacter endophyticus]GGH26619.1 cyclic nucleotide-binding protein [Dyadobacter endophyticus]
MELLGYFQQHLSLPAGLAQSIEPVFKHQDIKKGEIFLQPDNRSQKVCFIEKGLIRTYYLKDGKDITHLFFAENRFSVPLESIFYDRPSPYGWEALENSHIRIAQYKDLEPMFEKVPGFEKLIRLLLIDVIDVFSERLYAMQFQSAQDRYKALIEKHPDILLRAPLGHIASYLGITQQTLSVIRAAKFRD